ncbi:Aliphatic sulfonates import ATP-binding protein SsuB [Planctomycetales bacterium 10988]|nr:Aliphatic sulfonates import ATP-binding protein SsuB [Planctomycetales bacterium 10988]
MHADAFLSFQEVELAFEPGKPAVRDLNLAIESGEILSLVGPSGCGKSTLLRMIAGLERPTAGHLQLDGKSPGARNASLRIGYVFQEPHLLPWRTVRDNIRLPLELQGVSYEEQQAEVDQVLDLIELSPADGDKFPRMLSGGMRMRVSLARALVTRPQVLLMDEPFAALDDVIRQQLNEEVLRIWKEKELTTLFVTHHVPEAVFLSQRVLVMSPGPGTIVESIEIPFRYPRKWELRSTQEFAELTGTVGNVLRENAS